MSQIRRREETWRKEAFAQKHRAYLLGRRAVQAEAERDKLRLWVDSVSKVDTAPEWLREGARKCLAGAKQT